MWALMAGALTLSRAMVSLREVLTELSLGASTAVYALCGACLLEKAAAGARAVSCMCTASLKQRLTLLSTRYVSLAVS